MDEKNELAWARALADAFRRDDALEARTLVQWHDWMPNAPPPTRARADRIEPQLAANE